MSDELADCFRSGVLKWSREHRRNFPWRDRPEPFAVLIAEVMLRRTRAEQVMPVFEHFIQRFPDAKTLGEAPAEEVEKIVRPLGLAWRVPAFQQLARALVDWHGGAVPPDLEQLRALPGVGDYVASAVRAFAFDRPAVLVDTNTVRVAARFFGFAYHAESRRNRFVRSQVERLHDPSHPRESARALLDFAAVVCRALSPRHGDCPVAERCAYLRTEFSTSEGTTACS